MSEQGTQKAQDWWRTSIIRMEPGEIAFRGYAIEDLIGRVSFPAMIWLMLRGELPSPEQADLLGHALVAGVDHGPQAPSIAIARMAATCGVGINNAMASAVNALGDVHGGAGEQAVGVYYRIRARLDGGDTLEVATAQVLDELADEGVRYLPGFGHRFHPVDPRSPRLLELLDEARAAGHVEGRITAIARAVEAELGRRKGRRIPMNIDGATAAIFGELGFEPALCRGLFVLSRSVGILAHSWEQMQQPERNKGPLPRSMLWTYDGPGPRKVPR